jgi:hypothetical protein
MGITRGTDIVREGLVFSVDAANPRSYPGSGTTLYDLKRLNNGTMSGPLSPNNSPQFNPNNMGCIDFDGVDDRITFNNFDIGTSDFSVSSWIKTTQTSFGYIIAQGGQGNSAAERGFGMATNNGVLYGFIATDSRIFVSNNSGTLVNDGKWHNVAGVWDRSDKLKWYINGVFEKEGDISSASSYNISSDNNGLIGTYGNASIGFFDGNIGPTTLYLKALPAAEVKQNYKALKGRFIN